MSIMAYRMAALALLLAALLPMPAKSFLRGNSMARATRASAALRLRMAAGRMPWEMPDNNEGERKKSLRPRKRIRLEPVQTLQHRVKTREEREADRLLMNKAALELQWQITSLGAEAVNDMPGCKCKQCNGQGEVRCTVCSGSGRVLVNGKGNLKYCGSCKGHGKYVCSRCHGAGSVAVWMQNKKVKKQMKE
mmetsp:Transcript_26905/g.84381  ORF Transcript_26905/g.84381 Transcript_26905/m.84381 type:complete len:192 (-) Transcript_26905:1384-1959(-)